MAIHRECQYFTGSFAIFYGLLYMELFFIDIMARDIKELPKCFLWTLFPLWYAWTFPDIGLAFVIFFASMILLSLGLSGMVPDQEGKDSGCYMGSAIFLPAFYLLWGVFFHGFEAYQMERLTVYLGGETEQSACWQAAAGLEKVQKWMLQKQLSINSDYILSYLCSCYGILAAVFIAVLVLGLIFAAIKIAGRGKTVLGK